VIVNIGVALTPALAGYGYVLRVLDACWTSFTAWFNYFHLLFCQKNSPRALDQSL